MAKKIAFIRKTLVPLASIHIQAILQEQFPEYEVELIDITQIIRKRLDILIINGIFTLKEYWGVLIRRKKKFKECFFSTSYIFRKIKALMADYLSTDEYIFSIQMQSLYDASKEGLPHFVYTDNTLLANLYYENFDKNRLWTDQFIDRERSIYKNATIVFTRSSNVTRSLLEQYDCSNEKVVCVYAGSNVKRDRTQTVSKDYTNKRILFVGIDWHRKGGGELIEAFKAVLKVHSDAQLTIVGCSPKVDVPNCNVVGRVSLEQMNEYYAHSSVFCLPTKFEPFGIALLEAMTFKLPIVSTNVGAIPDFVVDGQNGYLIPPGDVNEIATALNKLLNSPAVCKEFGENGYSILKEKYTWENTGMLMKRYILPVLVGKASNIDSI